MKTDKNKLYDAHLNIINEMTEYIMEEVSSAELVEVKREWYESIDALLVTLSFNTGTRVHNVVIDWMGTIYDYSEKIPKHLLNDIHNGICAGYLKGIMDEAKSGNNV